ncbi:hypothetical protein Vretifemale_7132 [Volvox reticuliferus]|nr:hypothetical protein Vretifemale_7132 [Volvox reticuliferus]
MRCNRHKSNRVGLRWSGVRFLWREQPIGLQGGCFAMAGDLPSAGSGSPKGRACGEDARRTARRRNGMVQLFGRVRDDWIAADLNGWLAPNRIYEGVAGPVRTAMERHQVYIVTTKQAHYTEILMRDMASVPFPPDRIFSQTVSGRPKGEVLAALAAQHPDAVTKIFVEDKLSTLEKVARSVLRPP